MLNKNLSTKVVNPILLDKNISRTSDIFRLARYVDAGLLRGDQNTQDTITSLMEIITLLNVRLNSLEEWKYRESGEMDVLSVTSDDPSFIGKTAIAVTNVSMNSVRIANLEDEVSMVKQILGDTISATEVAFHAAAEQLNLLTDATNSMIINFKRVESRVKNLESFAAGGIRDKLKDSGTAGIKALIKGAGKILKASVEWIPEVEPIIDTFSDLADGIEFLINGIHSLTSKTNSYDYLRATGDNALLLSKYLSDSSEIRNLGATGIIMTPVVKTYIEIINTLFYFSLSSNNIIHQMPSLNYYLRPINNFAGDFVSPATKFLLESTKSYDLAQFTNRIPVHGYVTVDYPITLIGDPANPPNGAFRRQFVMSVGAQEITLSALLKSNTNAYVEYVDRIQRYDIISGVWNTVETIFQTPGVDPADFEEHIQYCSLVEHYTVKYSYNFIRNFFDCMHAHEEPYDLLNHNCQTMSREIINFAVTGSLPHFWNPECSRIAALAEFTNLYELPVSSVAYPMPKITITPTNYIVNTGGNPNALDVWRARENMNKQSWINALS